MPVFVAARGRPSPNLYRILDQFHTARAAGAVDGTLADGGPGVRDVADAGSYLTINAAGRVDVSDGGGANWQNPSLYYSDPGALAFNSAIGAVAALVRTEVASAIGPFFGVDPTLNAADPTSTGVGVWRDDATKELRIAGHTYNCMQPAGATALPRTFRNCDYALVLVPRATGGYFVIVSGAQYGTWPTGSILWIADADGLGNVYAGIASKTGEYTVAEFRVLRPEQMPASFRSQWGLATDYDTFTRADNEAMGNTEGKATAWSEASGDWHISSNAALPQGAGDRILTATGGNADGWTEATLHTATSGSIDIGLVIRYQDVNNFLVCLLGANTFSLYKREASSYTSLYASAPTVAADTVYRLLVYHKGTTINAWLIDGAGAVQDCMSGAPQTVTEFSDQTGFGARSNAIDGSSHVESIACWPLTVTLPRHLLNFPAVPNASGSATFTDAFTDADSTSLDAHNAAWTEHSGNWEINTNKARIATADTTGIATVAATVDACAEVTITLPGAPTWPDDWFCGLVLRYTDASTHLFARFLYQNDAPEIEMWNHSGGSPYLIQAVALGAGNLAAGSTHTMKFAVKGSRAAAYFDGELVSQGDVTLLTGTRAGIGINGDAVGQPTFDDFSVYGV